MLHMSFVGGIQSYAIELTIFDIGGSNPSAFCAADCQVITSVSCYGKVKVRFYGMRMLGTHRMGRHSLRCRSPGSEILRGFESLAERRW